MIDEQGVQHDVMLCWDTARVGRSRAGHDSYGYHKGKRRSRDLDGFNLATRRPIQMGRWICPMNSRKYMPPPGVLVEVFHLRHRQYDSKRSSNHYRRVKRERGRARELDTRRCSERDIQEAQNDSTKERSSSLHYEF
jgi:hypothetical protein